MFTLICVWINGCVNNREAGDLRRYCAHYGVTICCVLFMLCLHGYGYELISVVIGIVHLWVAISLQWRNNERDSVSNHQPDGCLSNCLFRRRSKKTSKLRVTGLCAGNSPGPVNSPHKGPVTRKMFPFDDVIMYHHIDYRCQTDVFLHTFKFRFTYHHRTHAITGTQQCHTIKEISKTSLIEIVL